ncbi:MAG: TlpA family protein disulfide reductase [Kofleriaceae bacterium]
MIRTAALSLATAFSLAELGCNAATTATAAAPPESPAQAAQPATAAAKPSRADQEKAGVAALVGTTPPEWNVERWMSSPPLTLASLRGSVVLVRWWTAGCPFCSATAPALRSFDRTYGPRGLKVIGMYHHKEATPFDPKVFEATARKYGFTFPVAFDPDWRTFYSWMRDKSGNAVETGWTSITFLLDKHGVVRHVHPGGQYVEGEPSYAELQAAIDRLLAEN